MKIVKFLLILLKQSILMALLLFISCSWMETDKDRDDLEKAIDGKYRAYFYPIAEVDDGETKGEFGLFSDQAFLHPWGRKIDRPVDRTILIDFQGNLAYVTVTCDIKGQFFVDTSDDNILNPKSKPLHDILTKYAVFEKADSGEWILRKVSPGEFKLYDEGKQTVHLKSVHIYDNDGEVDITITEPKTLYDVETEIPRFEVDEIVYVEVSAENTTDEDWTPKSFVYLHWPYSRDLFTDLGDDVHYKGNWSPHNDGVHHSAVDILNSGCIQNETNDDYNATAWAMPYIVE
ncbi:MAG: hypothetical protein ACUVWP_06455 [bacterium]